MKRRTLIDTIALTTIGFLLSSFEKYYRAATKSQEIGIYVATNGNDNWSGKLAKPNSSRTDGPLATLSRAREVVRKIEKNRETSRATSIDIFIREGIYYLPETLIFTSLDSGEIDFPITYKAYQNERPIISGGKVISSWQKSKIGTRQIWVATIPKTNNSNWYFRQLWSTKKRLIRTRHPSKGYFKLEDVIKNSQTERTNFKYKQGDLKNWQTISQSELIVLSGWKENRFPIAQLVESKSEVWTNKLPYYSEIKKGDLYYLEGCLETLDTPGEWFLDKNTSKIYYHPFPNESIAGFKVIAPTRSQLIKLDGVKYVTFQGLTFSHTDWYYDDNYQYGSYVQSGQNRQSNKPPNTGGYIGGIPGAIYAQNSHHCQWNSCTFSKLGGYGLEIANGSTNHRITNCRFFDLGAGGIILGKTKNNKVINCQLNDLGIVFHSGVGIFIADASDNYISNNHLYHLYHSGISVGWIWGYGDNLSARNIIDRNHIHDLGITSFQNSLPILNDKGAIYTLGVQPGTIIRDNKIHDIQAFNFGGWGIYLDEGSSNIAVRNNLVYNTRDGGFHQHYGRENIIENNIFAFGKNAQIRRANAENHLSFTFDRNIIYWETGKVWDGQLEDTSKFRSDRNLYWTKNRTNLRFGNLSLQQWQKKGLDRNSRIADPQFIDPKRGNFQLKASSPALQLGFKPLKNL